MTLLIIDLYLGPRIRACIGQTGDVDISIGADVAHVDAAIKGCQRRRLIAGVVGHLLPLAPGLPAVGAGVPVEQPVIAVCRGVITHHSSIKNPAQLGKCRSAGGQAAVIARPLRRESDVVDRAGLLADAPATLSIAELNGGVEPGGAVWIAGVGYGVDPDLIIERVAVAHIGQQQVARHAHWNAGQRCADATVDSIQRGALPLQIGIAGVDAAIGIELNTRQRCATGADEVEPLQSDRTVAVGVGEGKTRVGGGEHRSGTDRRLTACGREAGGELQAAAALCPGVDIDGAVVIQGQYGHATQPGGGGSFRGTDRHEADTAVALYALQQLRWCCPSAGRCRQIWRR